MPLLRRMARTAVVAGTATAVAGGVSRHQNQKWAAQEQQQAPEEDQQPAGEPAAPPVDPMERLKQLGALHEQGILTDEEFSSEKAKILNG